MKLQKIVFGFLLALHSNNFTMDNEGSEFDSMKKVPLAGAFVPGPKAKKTTLCRYPAVCFVFNEIKKAAGLEAKPDTDTEIVDAYTRISLPVRNVLSYHAANQRIGHDILRAGASLPQTSEGYKNVLTVLKEDGIDRIVMNPEPTSASLAILNHRLATVLEGSSDIH